jgi:hypothetical protein
MGWLFFLGGLVVGGLIILLVLHYIPDKFHKSAHNEVPHWSNRARPETYFVNVRGNKIFYEIRGDLTSKNCKGVLFVNVGYSAHTMRPTKHIFFEKLSNEGSDGKFWCVATFDFEGAGYSEGIRLKLFF